MSSSTKIANSTEITTTLTDEQIRSLISEFDGKKWFEINLPVFGGGNTDSSSSDDETHAVEETADETSENSYIVSISNNTEMHHCIESLIEGNSPAISSRQLLHYMRRFFNSSKLHLEREFRHLMSIMEATPFQACHQHTATLILA